MKCYAFSLICFSFNILRKNEPSLVNASPLCQSYLWSRLLAMPFSSFGCTAQTAFKTPPLRVLIIVGTLKGSSQFFLHGAAGRQTF